MTRGARAGGVILAIDSATTRVVVAAGTTGGDAARRDEWPAGYRHGETLLPAIERLARRAWTSAGRLVGDRRRDRARAPSPGCGSGSPRPRAWPRRSGCPIVGISTAEALLAGRAAARSRCCCSRPARRDRAGRDERRARRGCCRPEREPDVAPGTTLVAVDLPGRAPDDALARGEARACRPRRVAIALGAARLATGDVDDLAGLVPEYVTLPRGVTQRGRGGRMVARPSMILRIEPMRMEDLPAVHAIERASFDAPWPPRGVPARPGDEPPGPVPGRAGRRRDRGLRRDVADGRRGPHHTFAVHPDWRRQHIGERLLLAFLDLAAERGAHEATLEVRLSNLPARRLYEKFGFRPVGLRPRYYSDNGEDALIMTTEPLADAAMRDRVARLRAAIDAAPAPRRPSAGEPGR